MPCTAQVTPEKDRRQRGLFRGAEETGSDVRGRKGWSLARKLGKREEQRHSRPRGGGGEGRGLAFPDISFPPYRKGIESDRDDVAPLDLPGLRIKSSRFLLFQFAVPESRFSSTASCVSPRYLLLQVSRPGPGWEPFAVSISERRVSLRSVSLRANSCLPAGLQKESQTRRFSTRRLLNLKLTRRQDDSMRAGWG